MTITVVEDDPVTRNVLVRELRKMGYDVKAYHCAEELLKHFDKNHCDVVLTDLSLPGCSGEELLYKVEKASGGETKVLMMTAMDMKALYARGFEDVIRKATAVIKKGDSLSEFLSEVLSAVATIGLS